jgi:phosphatidylglycerol---prolipoprotein diacylglyceryl transferase
MYPILCDFGTIQLGGVKVPLAIGGYGALFALAAVAGWILIVILGRRISREAPWTDIFFVTLLSGVLGAKLANLLVFLPDLMAGRRTVGGALMGGGVWLGGIAASLAALWLMARRHGLPLGLVANAFFVFIPFSHAIGRIGCFLGGCCWGSASDLPWAVTYTDPAAHRLNGTPLGVPLHPTVLYESGLEMVNFLVALALWNKRVPGWTIVAAWMGLYGTERFLLEFLRSDPRGTYGLLSTSQWASLGMLSFAVYWFVLGRRGRRAGQPTETTVGAR